MLSKQQKIKLLEIARNSINHYLSGKSAPCDCNNEDKELEEERGVFVTLHKKGMLRGCIGNIYPIDKLSVAVCKMAIAAVHDPRFPPLTKEEFEENEIDIEISVLTVPEKIESADNIVLGRDGVIVKKGFLQGVYLPQVAEDTGWSKEEFLNSLCSSKAGLPADAWKDKNTELFSFQAEVFNEQEFYKE